MPFSALSAASQSFPQVQGTRRFLWPTMAAFFAYLGPLCCATKFSPIRWSLQSGCSQFIPWPIQMGYLSLSLDPSGSFRKYGDISYTPWPLDGCFAPIFRRFWLISVRFLQVMISPQKRPRRKAYEACERARAPSFWVRRDRETRLD